MEIDCNHWPLFYDYDFKSNTFIDPRVEREFNNWMQYQPAVYDSEII